MAFTPLDEALVVMTGVLDGLSSDQVDANRHEAATAEGIATSLRLARRHPEVFTELGGADGVRAAESAMLLELSLRLHLSEPRIRSLAHTVTVAQHLLPHTWRTARDGFLPLSLLDAAVSAALRLQSPEEAKGAERATAAEAIALLDGKASSWGPELTPTAFPCPPAHPCRPARSA
jgi:hypothetical protein